MHLFQQLEIDHIVGESHKDLCARKCANWGYDASF